MPDDRCEATDLPRTGPRHRLAARTLAAVGISSISLLIACRSDAQIPELGIDQVDDAGARPMPTESRDATVPTQSRDGGGDGAGLSDAAGDAGAQDSDVDVQVAAPILMLSGQFLFSIAAANAEFPRRTATTIEFIEVPSSTCTTSVLSSSCVFTVCPAAMPVPLRYAPEGAGSIVVDLGNDGGSYSFDGSGTGNYVSSPADGSSGYLPLLVAGESVTVTAGGDTRGIDAFSLLLNVPDEVSLTTPTLACAQPTGTTPGQCATRFARQTDLPVAWATGQVGGRIRVSLTTTTTSGPSASASKTLACDFDQRSSPAVIPSTNGMMLLDPVDSANGAIGSYVGSVFVVAHAESTADAGGVPVTASVTLSGSQTISYVNTD